MAIGRTNAGGGGTGARLTVAAPAGVTVTVAKDGKTKTRTANGSGVAEFRGLDSGTWEITISDGQKTATKNVEIVADYAVTMTFFSATIAVTWPEGSWCSCSDGVTTLTAPDTSGAYSFTVPYAGTWTVSCTDGKLTSEKSVEITTEGQSEVLVLAYTLVLYENGNRNIEVTGDFYYGYDATGSVVPEGTDSDGIKYLSFRTHETLYSTYTQSIKNPIDLTNYNTLVETSKHGRPEGSGDKIIIIDANGNEVARCNSQATSNLQTMTIDISNFTGMHRILFCDQKEGYDYWHLYSLKLTQ